MALYNSDLIYKTLDNYVMKTELSAKIGARIRHFRTIAGLTQMKLAELAQCEVSTLAHYETGKNLISMTKLIKISQILNIELYKFFIFESLELDKNKIKEIENLLKKANNTQLGLIYNIIQNILDLTPIE